MCIFNMFISFLYVSYLLYLSFSITNLDDEKLQADGDSGEFWVIFGGFVPIGKKAVSENDVIPEMTPPKLYCITEGQVEEVDGQHSKSLLETTNAIYWIVVQRCLFGMGE